MYGVVPLKSFFPPEYVYNPQFDIIVLRMTFSPVFWLYTFIQWILAKIFSPNPPTPGARLRRPKIAVIGAGLTGVSAAAHCVGHGFEVTLFEAGDKDQLGGIWAKGSGIL